MAEINGNVDISNPFSKGLLRVVSNTTLQDIEQKNAEAMKQQNEQPNTTLASHIEAVWQDNQQYKLENNIDEEMITNLRQRDGKYSADKLAAIQQQGGTDIFMGLTGVKCRAAEAWIYEVFMAGAEKPWQLKPTPVPELPPQEEQAIVERTMAEYMKTVQQKPMTPDEVFNLAAKLRDATQQAIDDDIATKAQKMDKKIYDQFVEGGFNEAFDDFLTDVVTLKGGFIKGPIVKKTNVLKYFMGPMGRTSYRIVEEIKLEYHRVSPFDMFPSRGQVGINDGELVERQKFTRKCLLDVKGIEGYNDKAIDLVLTEYGRGGLRLWTSTDQERLELEKKGTNLAAQKNLIDGIEYWGSVQGKLLLDYGMKTTPDGKEIYPTMEYEINAIKIGPYIIYVRFNPDPIGRRPYSKTGYAKIPGSFWYKGVPDLMNDLQNICNAAIRALVNNMGMASGPQVVIEDMSRIPAGTKISSLYAWKIWQLVNKTNSQLQGIRFHNVDSHAQELMAVYEKFAQLADDYTGIPAYAYGNENVSGAARTMGGLSILMNSAARGIKKVIYRIDLDVMKTLIQRQYDWNMIYVDDESIKGDAKIEAVGALGLIIKEQMAARRVEFLKETNNPVDLSIMGPERRANVLRQTAPAIGLPGDEVVPSKEEMKEKVKMMAAAAAQQQAPAGAIAPAA